MISTLPQAQMKPLSEGKSLGSAVLHAIGLELSFGGSQILSEVNLELRQGECVLLAGENGAGKTSLINILTGNLAPTSGQIHYSANGQNRSFSFPSRWWSDLNPWNQFRPEFVAKAGVGRSWQDVRLFGSLALRENLHVAATSGWTESPFSAFIPLQASSEESTVLADLGLQGREGSSADMISLGQSKRVAIARAIAAGAKVLFLDEPLSGLDRNGIESVVNYLRALVEEQHLTLVIVEHVFNQHHLLPLVTTRWELKDGVLSTRPAAEVVSDRRDEAREEWIQALIDAGSHVIEQELPRNARLTRIRIGDSREELPALEVKDLIVCLGLRQVLGIGDHGEPAPLLLKVNRGEIAVLEAPNGWGKTTLFKAIAGEIIPSSGAIKVNIGKFDSRATSDRINCVPSAGVLFPNLSLREAASVAQAKLPNRFEQIADRPCATLSGGERQRLALGLSMPCILNIYDEPLNGLDEWQEFVTSCRKQAQQGQAILILVPKK